MQQSPPFTRRISIHGLRYWTISPNSRIVPVSFIDLIRSQAEQKPALQN
jgi:hypothetical protein